MAMQQTPLLTSRPPREYTYLDAMRDAPDQMTAAPMPPQQQQPQATPLAGAGSSALGAYGMYQLGSNLLPGGAPAAPTILSATSIPSAPVTGAGLAEAAPWSWGAGQGAVPAAPNVVSATSTPTAAAPWGANAFATYGIPAAVIASTLMTGNSALDSLKAGQQGGVKEGIKSGFNDFDDLSTAFASGGLSIPIKLGAGILGGLTGTGKDKDQQRRDQLRKREQGIGGMGSDFMITNADGSKFDAGKDGNFLLPGGHMPGGFRHTYDVDFGNQAAVDLIPITDALAALSAGDDKKGMNDLSGILNNAAMSSGDSVQNIHKYFKDRGLDHTKAYGAIHMMQQNGQISQQMGDTIKNSLDKFFSKGHYASEGGKK